MPPAQHSATKKTVATQASTKAATKQTMPTGLMKAVQPSVALAAAIVGTQPLPRTEIIQRLWDSINTHGLQDVQNKRMINADTQLLPLFGEQEQISMLKLPKLVSAMCKKRSYRKAHTQGVLSWCENTLYGPCPNLHCPLNLRFHPRFHPPNRPYPPSPRSHLSQTHRARHICHVRSRAL